MNPVKLLRITSEGDNISEPIYETLPDHKVVKERFNESFMGINSPKMGRSYKYKLNKQFLNNELKERKPPLPKRNKSQSFSIELNEKGKAALNKKYAPHHESLHNIYTNNEVDDHEADYCKIKRDFTRCEPIYIDVEILEEIRRNLGVVDTEVNNDSHYCKFVPPAPRPRPTEPQHCEGGGGSTLGQLKSSPLPINPRGGGSTIGHLRSSPLAINPRDGVNYMKVDTTKKSSFEVNKKCPNTKRMTRRPQRSISMPIKPSNTEYVIITRRKQLENASIQQQQQEDYYHFTPLPLRTFQTPVIYENMLNDQQQYTEIDNTSSYEYMGPAFDPINEEHDDDDSFYENTPSSSSFTCSSLYGNMASSPLSTSSIYDNISSSSWSHSNELMYADVDFDRYKNNHHVNEKWERSITIPNNTVSSGACKEELYTPIDFEKSRGLSRALRGSRIESTSSDIYDVHLSSPSSRHLNDDIFTDTDYEMEEIFV